MHLPGDVVKRVGQLEPACPAGTHSRVDHAHGGRRRMLFTVGDGHDLPQPRSQPVSPLGTGESRRVTPHGFDRVSVTFSEQNHEQLPPAPQRTDAEHAGAKRQGAQPQRQPRIDGHGDHRTHQAQDASHPEVARRGAERVELALRLVRARNVALDHRLQLWHSPSMTPRQLGG
jgi:hypothetical protein